MEKFIWSEILTILSLILCFNLFDLVNGMVPGKVVKLKKKKSLGFFTISNYLLYRKLGLMN